MNIWYNIEEINNFHLFLQESLNNNQKILEYLKDEKCNLNNKNFFKYLHVDYWLKNCKIKKMRMNCLNLKEHYDYFKKMIESIEKISYVDYPFFINQVFEYNKIISKEMYYNLYESYITIRNIMINISKEKLIMNSMDYYYIINNIRKKLLNQNNYISINDVVYNKYFNNKWYLLINNYKSIEEIYNDALTMSWSYEQFYDFVNAYKLFSKIKNEEKKKVLLILQNENDKLKNIPIDFCLKSNDLISLLDKESLIYAKKNLLNQLKNDLIDEKSEEKIINSIYCINLQKNF